MLRSMSIRQFQEWREYGDLEPFDEGRADLRAASIVQAVRNSWRKRGSPIIKLADCVLPFGKTEDQPATPDDARKQVLSTMNTLMLIYNDKPKSAPRLKRNR